VGANPRCLAGATRHRSEVHERRATQLAYLDTPGISYYGIDMGPRETINGVPVTDAQIEAWAAEAEAGFDVAALKKRGRGRPGRGSEPSQVVAVRLTVEELAAIDAQAARSHQTRSQVIRDALASPAT
jgi:hypothetical protein